MPITESLLDHDLLGPVLKRGIEQGRQEGIQSGTHPGRRKCSAPSDGEALWSATLLGEHSTHSLTTPELHELSLRLLDVQTLDELVPR